MNSTCLYDDKDVMEEFISCYKHFRALWDSTTSDYTSKKKKATGYQELLKILRRVNHEASVQDVKRKINSLRCCYRRELKKIQNSYEGYEPRLWWFRTMEFLRPLMNIPAQEPTKDTSFASCAEESMSDEDFFNDSFNAEEDTLCLDSEPIIDTKLELKQDCTSEYVATNSDNHGISNTKSNNASLLKDRESRRRRHSSDDAEEANEFMESSIEVHHKKRRLLGQSAAMINRRRMYQDMDECELIGQRMAAHFRNMREDQRLFAERIMSEVLVYGRMNRLSLEARFLPDGGTHN